MAVLVGAVAVLTYLSRAVALVLPPPRGSAAALVERIPAPLFAGLAVLTLVGDGGITAVPVPVLWAALAALAVTPFRSLAITLVAGSIAYGLAAWL